MKNFHLTNVAKLYRKRFSSASSIKVPTAAECENVRQKSNWGYTGFSEVTERHFWTPLSTKVRLKTGSLDGFP